MTGGGNPDRFPNAGDSPIETTVRENVLRVRRPRTRWLSSGWNGGFERAAAAYNVSVPTGFSSTDLDRYLADRRSTAGFARPGPTLLTGLALDHVRGARSGPVAVVATAGLSNPATLPVSSPWSDDTSQTGSGAVCDASRLTELDGPETDRFGTVNLIVSTTRALDDAGMTTLLASAVEAKTATLLALTGFSGTTSDAVVVGCDPAGEFEQFAGSATRVGDATRACVRDAVLASLASRYPAGEFPRTVADAEYGIATTRSTTLFQPK